MIGKHEIAAGVGIVVRPVRQFIGNGDQVLNPPKAEHVVVHNATLTHAIDSLEIGTHVGRQDDIVLSFELSDLLFRRAPWQFNAMAGPMCG